MRLSLIISLLAVGAAAMPAAEQAAAGITAKPTATVNTHCPTITRTGTRCHTCPAPDCIVLSTISNPCDCASPVPTVTVNHPCKSGCSGACATEYVFDTSTSTCPTATPPSTTCEATVTVHSYPSDGCAYTCTSGFCIIDKFVTAPCGCSSFGVVTSTSTLPCPTASGCELCTTGFPFTTTTDCPSAPTGCPAVLAAK